MPGQGLERSTHLGSLCPQGAHRLAGAGPTISQSASRAQSGCSGREGKNSKPAWVAQGSSQLLNPGLQALRQIPCQVNSIISSQRTASLSQWFEWKANKVACGSSNPYLFAQHYKKTLLLDGDHVSPTREIMLL